MHSFCFSPNSPKKRLLNSVNINNGIGIFTLAIGIPTVYGGLLVCGIPRVIVTSYYSRKKLKKGDVRTTVQDEERAPLLSREQPAAPVSRSSVPAVAVAPTPPSYFPAPHNVGAPAYQAAAPPLMYAVSEDEQLYNK